MSYQCRFEILFVLKEIKKLSKFQILLFYLNNIIVLKVTKYKSKSGKYVKKDLTNFYTLENLILNSLVKKLAKYCYLDKNIKLFLGLEMKIK